MPADKYGKKPYSAGTVKAEKAAIANRDPARKAAAMKLLAQEGTTSAGGGRLATKVPAVLRTTRDAPPPKPIRMPANPNKPATRQNAIIRTTTNMKPTPMGKKR